MEVVSEGGLNSPLVGSVDIEYRRLGCFPRASDDKDVLTKLRDTLCVTYSGSGTCRGGLPFYRMVLVDPNGAQGQCFRFCASKGLDLFGLVDGNSECRCGATEANAAVWRYKHEEDMNQPLQLDLSQRINGSSEAACERSDLEVFQYDGWMERPAAGGVPWLLMEASPQDVEYIDGIVHGTEIKSIGAAEKLPAGLVNNPEGTSGVGKLWPQVFGVAGVRVFYVFDEQVDASMRSVFLTAAEEWNFKSSGCVQLVEAKGSQKHHSRLVVGTAEACGPSGPGYPGQGEPMPFSLGACGTERDVNRVVKEIALVLDLQLPLPSALAAYPCHGERDAARSFFQKSHEHMMLDREGGSAM